MKAKRARRRYLQFKVVSERNHPENDVADSIQRGVMKLYGIVGLSRIEPSLLEFNEEGQIGILRCSHLCLRQMRASLSFITSIGDSNAMIYVLRVSGTLKSLRSHNDE